MIKTNSSIESDGKCVIAVGSILGRDKLIRVLDPLIAPGALGFDLGGAEDIIGQVGLQGGGELSVVLALDPEASLVGLLLHVHSPVALVLESNHTRPTRGPHAHRGWESIRERLIEHLDAKSRIVDWKVSVSADRVSSAVLEGSVADQFSVDTAVAGVVDVLVEETVAGLCRMSAPYTSELAVFLPVHNRWHCLQS
jgi:hypothetical protein